VAGERVAQAALGHQADAELGGLLTEAGEQLGVHAGDAAGHLILEDRPVDDHTHAACSSRPEASYDPLVEPLPALTPW
jgi:hypothetical protein